MLANMKKLLLLVPITGVMFLSTPSWAESSWSVNIGLGDRGFHHREHRVLSHDYRTYRHHGHRYYFSDGYFYEGGPGKYVIVNPPIGVIVSNVPSGCRQHWINGRVYYEYNNIYYVPGLAGYQVVAPPVTVVEPTTYVSNASTQTTVIANNQDDLTINIPNSQGGFTPVTLKRSGNGFLGPQGEYYSEFPKVAQLKTMYVK